MQQTIAPSSVTPHRAFPARHHSGLFTETCHAKSGVPQFRTNNTRKSPGPRERSGVFGSEQQISTFELRRAWRPKIFRFAFNAIRSGGLNLEHLTQVSTLADGDLLNVPGHPIAVHTPGHTQGHPSLHLPDRGVLISGDALITIDLWDHDRRGPQMIRPQFNHDHTQAIRSLDRLADLEADVILPGHGEPWRGRPAAAVELARQRL